MVIGSHNSWSYLKPRKWWLYPFMFMARCQSVGIREQYNKYDVRCFDLRIRFNENGDIVIAHGFMEYKYNNLLDDLKWLNLKGDCYVRLIHEVRNKIQYTEESIKRFREVCSSFEKEYDKIKFWCGRNLYNWQFDYDFGVEPLCEENYSSVKAPKLIDDWFPWIYARRKNKKIIKNGTHLEILLIDFVNIR